MPWEHKVSQRVGETGVHIDVTMMLFWCQTMTSPSVQREFSTSTIGDLALPHDCGNICPDVELEVLCHLSCTYAHKPVHCMDVQGS